VCVPSYSGAQTAGAAAFRHPVGLTRGARKFDPEVVRMSLCKGARWTGDSTGTSDGLSLVGLLA